MLSGSGPHNFGDFRDIVLQFYRPSSRVSIFALEHVAAQPCQKFGHEKSMDVKNNPDHATIGKDASLLCQHSNEAGRMQGSGHCILHLAISTHSLEQMQDAIR
jgi:hypothetical protein